MQHCVALLQLEVVAHVVVYSSSSALRSIYALSPVTFDSEVLLNKNYIISTKEMWWTSSYFVAQ